MSFLRKSFWDSTFPVLRLKGKGARAFLHGQLTAEIINANTNTFIYGCWLSTKGCVKAVVEILLTDEGADLIVIGGHFKEIYEGFNQVIFPVDQVFIESNLNLRRLQVLSLREPWHKNEVFWLSEKQSIPDSLDSHSRATNEEVEIWRLHQGLPLTDAELNGETNPFELGLGDFVSLEKGCYLGQETIARVLRQTSLKRKLMFWESENKVLGGQKIIKRSLEETKEGNQKIAGVITSSSLSKSSGSFGLALIRSNYFEEDNLSLLNSQGQIYLKLPIGFQ
tara:strand:- start:9768 stop:10607 length:840 start_codon:yes stop_codon:yes gene_type:complete